MHSIRLLFSRLIIVRCSEVQVNLELMIQAKDKAHDYYEKVRGALPAICQSCGVKADELERFLVKLLQSSVLDSAVRTLEAKAGTYMTSVSHFSIQCLS